MEEFIVKLYESDLNKEILKVFPIYAIIVCFIVLVGNANKVIETILIYGMIIYLIFTVIYRMMLIVNSNEKND